MKKLIVCDMSGIASTRGKNNDELLNALNNLKNYNCSFCTGKGYSGGYVTLKNIDLKVPFICENGSVLVKKDGEIMYNEKMNSHDVVELIKNIDLENVCRITTRGLSGENKIESLNKFHVVVSEREFHSICSIGVNKGSGIKKLAEYCNLSLNDIIIIGNDMNDIDMFKLDCGLKIATGSEKPPKELLELSSIYVPLNELPNFIMEVDKNKN